MTTQKTYPIPIRLSENERDRVRNEAKKDGMSVSEWLRRRIEGERVECRVETIESIFDRFTKLESLLNRLVAEKEGK